MTVVESPKGRASHNLGNRCAIPTFPPPGYCYIFFQNLSRKESSSPPAPSLFRLILRLEKTDCRGDPTKKCAFSNLQSILEFACITFTLALDRQVRLLGVPLEMWLLPASSQPSLFL